MDQPYEPRAVGEAAFGDWVRQGWALAQRNVLLWFGFGLALPLLTVAVFGMIIGLVDVGVSMLPFRLLLLTLFPLLLVPYLCVGMLLAANADGRLSRQVLWRQLRSATPVRYGLWLVFARPNRWRLSLYTLVFVVPPLLSFLVSLSPPPAQSEVTPLPPPVSPLPAVTPTFVEELAAMMTALLSLTGPSAALCAATFAPLLLTLRRRGPHAFMHRKLLGVSWPEAEVLVANALRKNPLPLLQLDTLPYVLLVFAAAPLIFSFGSLPLALALCCILLLGVALTSCVLYCAWRDLYLGRRENAPVPKKPSLRARTALPVQPPA